MRWTAQHDTRLPHRFRSLAIALACLLGATGCATRLSTREARPIGAPPAEILGDFEDDYGSVYQITSDTWRHGATTTYEIVTWHADSQYVIARNGAANPSAPRRWTRIDWMPLANMLPYTWAFCFTAYNALSPAAAASTTAANRADPRTGCGKYPFSRMKRRGE